MGALPDMSYGATATIAGTAARTSAWSMVNIEVLGNPAARERQNRSLAGIGGSLGMPAVTLERSFELRYFVIGDVTPAGAPPVVDGPTQLAANLAVLRAMYDTPEDNRGTIPVTYLDRAGVTWAGRIQLDDFDVQKGEDPLSRWLFIAATLPLGELGLVP